MLSTPGQDNEEIEFSDDHSWNANNNFETVVIQQFEHRIDQKAVKKLHKPITQLEFLQHITCVRCNLVVGPSGLACAEKFKKTNLECGKVICFPCFEKN